MTKNAKHRQESQKRKFSKTQVRTKLSGSTLPVNEKICAHLRLTGLFIILASLLMTLLPLMFSGVHRYISTVSTSYMSTSANNIMVITGITVSLLYFLLGINIIRAGECNTRLARVVYQINIILTFLAFVAGVMLFVPWPVPIFQEMTARIASGAHIDRGIVPMFFLIYIDIAIVIGLTASTSGIIYACLIDKEKGK